MNTRTVIFGLGLVAGCGPGTDESSEAGSSGGTAATDGATSTTGGTTAVTTGATTGGATGTSGDSTVTATTDATTTAATTGTTTTATTGGACEIAGELDCALLVEFSGELTMQECEMCQGAPCGAVPECNNYPCVDGQVVIRGCCEDSECADLTPFCGMFIAVNNVCVQSDDI
jgi:hypothetical protein